MDHALEALIRLACAHSDAFEFFEFTKEILDEMPPFVHFGVDVDWLGATWMLRDDDLGASGVEVVDYPIRIKSLVSQESAKLEVLDQRFDTNRIKSMAGKQNEVHQVAEGIRQRENLRRHPAL